MLLGGGIGTLEHNLQGDKCPHKHNHRILCVCSRRGHILNQRVSCGIDENFELARLDGDFLVSPAVDASFPLDVKSSSRVCWTSYSGPTVAFSTIGTSPRRRAWMRLESHWKSGISPIIPTQSWLPHKKHAVMAKGFWPYGGTNERGPYGTSVSSTLGMLCLVWKPMVCAFTQRPQTDRHVPLSWRSTIALHSCLTAAFPETLGSPHSFLSSFNASGTLLKVAHKRTPVPRKRYTGQSLALSGFATLLEVHPHEPWIVAPSVTCIKSLVPILDNNLVTFGSAALPLRTPTGNLGSSQ